MACLRLFFVQGNGLRGKLLPTELSSLENPQLSLDSSPSLLRQPHSGKHFHTLGSHYCSALGIFSESSAGFPSLPHVMKAPAVIIQLHCVSRARGMFSDCGTEPQNNFTAIKYMNVQF